MSAAPLRLVAAEPDWRAALAAAIRPQFRVAVYEADPEDRWLYGPHCAVAGCELPSRRPLHRRDGIYVCNGHLHNYREHGDGDWQRWLAAAGPLRAQRRSRPRYRLAVGGLIDAELRYGLQCWHDGQHPVVLGAERWGGLLLGLERVGVGSLLELDPTRMRATFGARGEASFVRRVVDRFRRGTLGLDDRHADVVGARGL